MLNEKVIPSVPNSSIKIYISQSPNENQMMSDWHLHNKYEMIYIEKGEKFIYVNNNEYTIKKGDIAFINKNIPHKTITPKGTKNMLIQFSEEKLYDDKSTENNLFTKNKSDISIIKAGTSLNLKIRKIIYKIRNEYCEKDDNFDIFIKSYIYEISALLYRNKILLNLTSENTGDLSRITPVLDYIDKHYFEPISLYDMSKLLNIDKSHFCRLFKQYTNTTFINYLNFVRVEKAKNMLLHTDNNISEISYSVGFSSVAYFIKTFKNLNYCTPAKYRKMIRTI